MEVGSQRQRTIQDLQQVTIHVSDRCQRLRLYSADAASSNKWRSDSGSSNNDTCSLRIIRYIAIGRSDRRSSSIHLLSGWKCASQATLTYLGSCGRTHTVAVTRCQWLRIQCAGRDCCKQWRSDSSAVTTTPCDLRSDYNGTLTIGAVTGGVAHTLTQWMEVRSPQRRTIQDLQQGHILWQ